MASFSGDGINHLLMEVSPDIHICGFCKQQYNNFEVFLAHKQNGCQIPTTDISSPNSGAAGAGMSESIQEFALEEAFQACVSKVVKKSMSKTQKTSSKKLKPALAQKRHICSFSGCTFKTQYGQKDMERHMLTHTGERPFECELCHKRFSRRDKLNLHSRSHTGEKPHRCKHCSYAAADSSSLKKHLRVHYDERPFKCQICPYASRNSSQLTVHLRSHTGDAPFQCSQCDAKFKINSDLKRHSRIHSGEKPYQCDLCEYRCAMKANLKSHVQLKHGAAGAYSCPDCDFRCSAKAALRRHARQHRPAQPLQCAQCSYSCSSKGALKIHERVHSDERPFACERCPFASKQRSNLLIHRRKCHGEKAEGRGKAGRGGGAGEEPPKPLSPRYRARLEAARAFRCNLCDASFVREDSLRSHKRQHGNGQHQGLGENAAITQAQSTTMSSAKATVQDTGQASLAFAGNSLSSYSSTQLKIIVAPSLGPEGTFIQASMDDPSSKPRAVLLSSEGQDVLLNPVIQQVNLLTPVQHMAPPAEGSLEHQTVLLTHISPSEESTLQENLLQTAVSSQTTDPAESFISTCAAPSTDSGHTFITACSDLDSLHALIQQGGTEVTVVTEGSASVTATSGPAFSPPLDIDRPPSQDLPKQSGDCVPDEEGSLVMNGLAMEPSSTLLVHSVPLSISTQDQQTPIYQLSPHNIFSDSNTADSSED
ncbi:zinc finger protein 64 isoform X1 [Electrophorus electricus]|uniref:C2H2-type domain-containing protein n=1 Tax=Electrophorus electricus TaxID=8005 RepID=A0A4W4HP56_ELEEL|nr:zinc finger protein 64 isoform X1 [Electrophorus electricus]